MKNMLLAVLLAGLGAASAFAACSGPYCFDDTGASIGANVGVGGVLTNTQPMGLVSKTLAQINATTPSAAGQVVYCSNCVNSAVCVSSGTGTAAFVSSSSPTVHCDVR